MGIQFPSLPITLPNPLEAIGGAKDAASDLVGTVKSVVPETDFVAAENLLETTRQQRGSAPPIPVVTFNAGSGNPDDVHTDPTEFPQLPFYQQVLRGDADAPIVNLQEVSDAHAEELLRLSESGDFSMIDARAKPGQHNVMLIPKRYEVLDYESGPFVGGQVKGAINTLFDKVTGGDSDLAQAIEARMLTEARLKDRITGRELTVFNTHLSGEELVRSEQAATLSQRLGAAAERGPVILAGDLNLKPDDNETDRSILEALSDRGFSDLGPLHAPPGRANVDYTLASGLRGLSSRYLTDLSLPSAPTAAQVSDHYAEETVLQLTPKDPRSWGVRR